MIADHGVLRLLYDNTHELAPGRLWRTFQPPPAALARWRARGVRTVVNLRGRTDSPVWLLEDAVCRELGMRLVDFRVYSREAPSPEVIHGAQRLFREIDYPAIMHCKSGADRVGVMATLWRFFEGDAPLDVALGELSLRFGHIRQGKTGVIDYAFERYLAYARERGLDLSSKDDFLAWVDGPYDPVAIKAEFLGSWWGNFLTERLLRRE